MRDREIEYDLVRNSYVRAGQAQVFRFWDSLTATEREKLISQAAEIDLEELGRLVRELVQGDSKPLLDFEGLEPTPSIRWPRTDVERARWRIAAQLGEEAVRAGRVAALTVAGGQGTRLGLSGPKGVVAVTPVRSKSLFQVLAEKIQAAELSYGVAVPWFMMTSLSNHGETVDFFACNDHFGLSPENVEFFVQGQRPAVDHEGKIIMESRETISMSPDGHGGTVRALVGSGALGRMRARGIDLISYFQVDNPLVRPIDPAFIGWHLQAGSEMSSKMVHKAYPEEKVGVFCLHEGHLVVVEYSDLPLELALERDRAGNLRYQCGSIAIHLLAVDFVERIGRRGGLEQGLPFHRADKKMIACDEDGNPSESDRPNGIKFEMFIFDALSLARNPTVVETLRMDEFSPVKNASGIDSLEACRKDQIRQWTRWLKAAGRPLAVDSSGLPSISFEVSPLFAEDEESFIERWRGLPKKPEIVEGTYLGPSIALSRKNALNEATH